VLVVGFLAIVPLFYWSGTPSPGRPVTLGAFGRAYGGHAQAGTMLATPWRSP